MTDTKAFSPADPDPSPAPEAGFVSKEEATLPFVLAMDIGSSSARAAVYDASARPIRTSEAKVDHVFIEGADGTAEIDADQVTGEIADLITQATAPFAPGEIKGVAMDTFASSLVCVDAGGKALTPCYTYADSRSAPQLAQLRQELDETEIHQAVGARLHTSYHAPRLLWIERTQPLVWKRTARFLSLGEYIFERLAGVKGAATSTMAWTGMLNRYTGDLDQTLLDATDTSREQFGEIVDPDQPRRPTTDVAARWPALSDAVWFPAIPDGFASNLGTGATDAENVALSAATSGAMRVIVPGTPGILPTGLWAYRVSSTQSIVGGALNDVGRVMLWLESTLAPVTPEELDSTFRAAPKNGTPLVLPFLTGERATGWAGNARAVFSGVSSANGPLDIWRGSAEGVAASYQRIFAQLSSINPHIKKVVALGGVTQHYPGTMAITAEALGFPIDVVDVRRVTMRGTAVMALQTLAPEQAPAPVPIVRTESPDPEHCTYYQELAEHFEASYIGNIAER